MNKDSSGNFVLQGLTNRFCFDSKNHTVILDYCHIVGKHAKPLSNSYDLSLPALSMLLSVIFELPCSFKNNSSICPLSEYAPTMVLNNAAFPTTAGHCSILTVFNLGSLY